MNWASQRMRFTLRRAIRLEEERQNEQQAQTLLHALMVFGCDCGGPPMPDEKDEGLVPWLQEHSEHGNERLFAALMHADVNPKTNRKAG